MFLHTMQERYVNAIFFKLTILLAALSLFMVVLIFYGFVHFESYDLEIRFRLNQVCLFICEVIVNS